MSTVWRFPAAGFAVASMAATGPLNPEAWPAQGAFGAFTWTAGFVTGGLTLTLLALSASPAARRVGVNGRALAAGLAFGVLMLACYIAAARADAIEQNPVLALAVALALLGALRAVTARLVVPWGVGAEQ